MGSPPAPQFEAATVSAESTVDASARSSGDAPPLDDEVAAEDDDDDDDDDDDEDEDELEDEGFADEEDEDEEDEDEATEFTTLDQPRPRVLLR